MGNEPVRANTLPGVSPVRGGLDRVPYDALKLNYMQSPQSRRHTWHECSERAGEHRPTLCLRCQFRLIPQASLFPRSRSRPLSVPLSCALSHPARSPPPPPPPPRPFLACIMHTVFCEVPWDAIQATPVPSPAPLRVPLHPHPGRGLLASPFDTRGDAATVALSLSCLAVSPDAQ